MLDNAVPRSMEVGKLVLAGNQIEIKLRHRGSRFPFPAAPRAARRGAQCSGERIVQSARLPLPRSGRREIPHHKNSGLVCQFDFPHPAR